MMRRLLLNYGDYDDDAVQEYYDEDEDEQILDGWLDGWLDEYDDAEWVILDDNDDTFIEDNFGELDFNDDSIWDEVMTNIQTLKGRSLDKKCMNIFGRKLCICQFMDWLNGKVIGGNTKHICYAPKYEGAAITKKTIIKKQLDKAIKNEKKEKVALDKVIQN